MNRTLLVLCTVMMLNGVREPLCEPNIICFMYCDDALME